MHPVSFQNAAVFKRIRQKRLDKQECANMIRTAVVGLGRIGWYFHVPEIVKHGNDFSLCAVLDTSRERLKIDSVERTWNLLLSILKKL